MAHKKGEIKSTERTIQGGSYISNNNQLRGDCNHTEENRNNNETYESKLLDTIVHVTRKTTDSLDSLEKINPTCPCSYNYIFTLHSSLYSIDKAQQFHN